jgi:myo-inositol-1(or 4)-monophosphatase
MSQAGIVIAQEAGCLVTGSHSSPHDGEVTPQILLGRKYFLVRAIADTAVRWLYFPQVTLTT